jgi:TRAP-type C4-dicarboxylate transport system permease small subunit
VRAITTILDAIYRITEAIANLIMLALFVIVLLGVVSRYVFNDPFVWTEELALFLLAWMVFLAANLLIKDWDNLRVTYFIEKLPAGLCAAVELLSKLLVLGFLVYVFTIAVKVIPEIGPTETSPVLGITMELPQSSIIVGFALMIVQLVGLLAGTLLSLARKQGV